MCNFISMKKSMLFSFLLISSIISCQRPQHIDGCGFCGLMSGGTMSVFNSQGETIKVDEVQLVDPFTNVVLNTATVDSSLTFEPPPFNTSKLIYHYALLPFDDMQIFPKINAPRTLRVQAVTNGNIIVYKDIRMIKQCCQYVVLAGSNIDLNLP